MGRVGSKIVSLTEAFFLFLSVVAVRVILPVPRGTRVLLFSIFASFEGDTDQVTPLTATPSGRRVHFNSSLLR